MSSPQPPKVAASKRARKGGVPGTAHAGGGGEIIGDSNNVVGGASANATASSSVEKKATVIPAPTNVISYSNTSVPPSAIGIYQFAHGRQIFCVATLNKGIEHRLIQRFEDHPEDMLLYSPTKPSNLVLDSNALLSTKALYSTGTLRSHPHHLKPCPDPHDIVKIAAGTDNGILIDVLNESRIVLEWTCREHCDWRDANTLLCTAGQYDASAAGGRTAIAGGGSGSGGQQPSRLMLFDLRTSPATATTQINRFNLRYQEAIKDLTISTANPNYAAVVLKESSSKAVSGSSRIVLIDLRKAGGGGGGTTTTTIASSSNEDLTCGASEVLEEIFGDSKDSATCCKFKSTSANSTFLYANNNNHVNTMMSNESNNNNTTDRLAVGTDKGVLFRELRSGMLVNPSSSHLTSLPNNGAISSSSGVFLRARQPLRRIRWRPVFDDYLATSYGGLMANLHVWHSALPTAPLLYSNDHGNDVTDFAWVDHNHIISCGKDAKTRIVNVGNRMKLLQARNEEIRILREDVTDPFVGKVGGVGGAASLSTAKTAGGRGGEEREEEKVIKSEAEGSGLISFALKTEPAAGFSKIRQRILEGTLTASSSGMNANANADASTDVNTKTTASADSTMMIMKTKQTTESSAPASNTERVAAATVNHPVSSPPLPLQIVDPKGFTAMPPNTNYTHHRNNVCYFTEAVGTPCCLVVRHRGVDGGASSSSSSRRRDGESCDKEDHDDGGDDDDENAVFVAAAGPSNSAIAITVDAKVITTAVDGPLLTPAYVAEVLSREGVQSPKTKTSLGSHQPSSHHAPTLLQPAAAASPSSVSLSSSSLLPLPPVEVLRALLGKKDVIVPSGDDIEAEREKTEANVEQELNLIRAEYGLSTATVNSNKSEGEQQPSATATTVVGIAGGSSSQQQQQQLANGLSSQTSKQPAAVSTVAATATTATVSTSSSAHSSTLAAAPSSKASSTPPPASSQPPTSTAATTAVVTTPPPPPTPAPKKKESVLYMLRKKMFSKNEDNNNNTASSLSTPTTAVVAAPVTPTTAPSTSSASTSKPSSLGVGVVNSSNQQKSGTTVRATKAAEQHQHSSSSTASQQKQANPPTTTASTTTTATTTTAAVKTIAVYDTLVEPLRALAQSVHVPSKIVVKPMESLSMSNPDGVVKKKSTHKAKEAADDEGKRKLGEQHENEKTENHEKQKKAKTATKLKKSPLTLEMERYLQLSSSSCSSAAAAEPGPFSHLFTICSEEFIIRLVKRSKLWQQQQQQQQQQQRRPPPSNACHVQETLPTAATTTSGVATAASSSVAIATTTTPTAVQQNSNNNNSGSGLPSPRQLQASDLGCPSLGGGGGGEEGDSGGANPYDESLGTTPLAGAAVAAKRSVGPPQETPIAVSSSSSSSSQKPMMVTVTTAPPPTTTTPINPWNSSHAAAIAPYSCTTAVESNINNTIQQQLPKQPDNPHFALISSPSSSPFGSNNNTNQQQHMPFALTLISYVAWGQVELYKSLSSASSSARNGESANSASAADWFAIFNMARSATLAPFSTVYVNLLKQHLVRSIDDMSERGDFVGALVLYFTIILFEHVSGETILLPTGYASSSSSGGHSGGGGAAAVPASGGEEKDGSLLPYPTVICVPPASSSYASSSSSSASNNHNMTNNNITNIPCLRNDFSQPQWRYRSLEWIEATLCLFREEEKGGKGTRGGGGAGRGRRKRGAVDEREMMAVGQMIAHDSAFFSESMREYFNNNRLECGYCSSSLNSDGAAGGSTNSTRMPPQQYTVNDNNPSSALGTAVTANTNTSAAAPSLSAAATNNNAAPDGSTTATTGGGGGAADTAPATGGGVATEITNQNDAGGGGESCPSASAATNTAANKMTNTSSTTTKSNLRCGCRDALKMNASPLDPITITNPQLHSTSAHICAICDEVVEGIFHWFPACGHGAHPEHLRMWVERSLSVQKRKSSAAAAKRRRGGGGGGAEGGQVSLDPDACVRCPKCALVILSSETIRSGIIPF